MGIPVSYTIGPFVGYRLQFGNFVVGIEGDASYKKGESSLSQSSSTSLVVSSSSGTGAFSSSFLRTDQFSGSVKQGWDYSIRGRLGTLITPWSLLYLTGGVAFGEISGTFAYTGTLYNCFGSSGCSHERSGYGKHRSELERHPGWRHGRRWLGNRDRARLEGESRVPVHGFRQLHQDLQFIHRRALAVLRRPAA